MEIENKYETVMCKVCGKKFLRLKNENKSKTNRIFKSARKSNCVTCSRLCTKEYSKYFYRYRYG